MITQNRYDLGDMSYQGLSTDTKPTLAPVNSLFLELDTKTLYYCSQSGSQSEEVVYEGEVTEDLTQIRDFDPTSLSDTITVVFDGTKYVCEKKTNEVNIQYWGADRVGERSFDWGQYPFCIKISLSLHGSFVTIYKQTAESTVSLSITSLVTTEAEWVKYGEAPSGGDSGVTGNLETGVTIQPSAWENGTVNVEYFPLKLGLAYQIFVNDSPEDSAHAEDNGNNEVSVYSQNANYSFISNNVDETTRIETLYDAPTEPVTLRLSESIG